MYNTVPKYPINWPDIRDLLRWMHLILTHMDAVFKLISFINQLYSWPSIAGAYPTIFTVICVIYPPPPTSLPGSG